MFAWILSDEKSWNVGKYPSDKQRRWFHWLFDPWRNPAGTSKPHYSKDVKPTSGWTRSLGVDPNNIPNGMDRISPRLSTLDHHLLLLRPHYRCHELGMYLLQCNQPLQSAEAERWKRLTIHYASSLPKNHFAVEIAKRRGRSFGAQQSSSEAD